MSSGTAEAFGKQWQVGDVVGVFLDLIDKTISKRQSFDSFYCAKTFLLELTYWTLRFDFQNKFIHVKNSMFSTFLFY